MKCAMIGLGMVSSTYADALPQIPGLTLSGVFARSEESRAAFLAANPGLRAYGSAEEIAQDPQIDFVIVTTPPNARGEITRTLAAAGKHILMEKPVERNLKAATGIVETCEAAGITLGIVLQHRARPSAVHMRSLLGTGSLGLLHLVEICVPWWREQAYYDVPGRGSFARDGGGVMISQAIHTLDLMLSLTGPVTQITAMTGTTGFHKMEAEDFASAGLKFRSGALGTLFATTSAFPGRAEGIRLHFANASVDLQSNALEITYQDGRCETHGAAASTGAGADPMAFTSDWHRAIITDFCDALREKRPPLVPGREALKVHGLIDALERSAQQGARITL